MKATFMSLNLSDFCALCTFISLRLTIYLYNHSGAVVTIYMSLLTDSMEGHSKGRQVSW